MHNQCSLREGNEVQYIHISLSLPVWLGEVQFILSCIDCVKPFVAPRESKTLPASDSLIGLVIHFEKGSSGWACKDSVPIRMCYTSFPSLKEHWLYA